MYNKIIFRWSVEHYDKFWDHMWHFMNIKASQQPDCVINILNIQITLQQPLRTKFEIHMARRLLNSISRNLNEQITERKSMRSSKKMGNNKTIKNQRQDDKDGSNWRTSCWSLITNDVSLQRRRPYHLYFVNSSSIPCSSAWHQLSSLPVAAPEA